MLLTRRDEFVEIMVDNIINPRIAEDAFGKNSPARVLDYGPYDFGSVMHYGDTAALKKELIGKNKKTIVGKVKDKMVCT